MANSPDDYYNDDDDDDDDGQCRKSPSNLAQAILWDTHDYCLRTSNDGGRSQTANKPCVFGSRYSVAYNVHTQQQQNEMHTLQPHYERCRICLYVNNIDYCLCVCQTQYARTCAYYM